MTTEQSLRQDILDKFGNRCKCCGFNHPAALQIDHINGGGHQELRLLRGRRHFYKKVLEDDGLSYQLLCANCNRIKQVLCQERGKKFKLEKEEFLRLRYKRTELSTKEKLFFETLAENFETKDFDTFTPHHNTRNRFLRKLQSLGLTTKTARGRWQKTEPFNQP